MEKKNEKLAEKLKQPGFKAMMAGAVAGALAASKDLFTSDGASITTDSDDSGSDDSSDDSDS